MSHYNVDEPWVRQPCDTDLTWFLFQTFLHSPTPRRLTVLLKTVHLSGMRLEQLKTISSEDAWFARAYAWDAHLDRLRNQTVEETVKEDARQRAERHSKLYRKVARLGELEIDRLIDVLSRGDIPGVITPRDAIRAAILGSRSEREAMGDFVDRADGALDLSSLTLEELRAVKQIQEKVTPTR